MKKSFNKLMLVSSIVVSVLLSACGNSEVEKDITQLKGNDNPTLEDRIAANMPKEIDGLAEQYRTTPPPSTDFNSVIAMHNNQSPQENNNTANTVDNTIVNSSNTTNSNLDSEYQANLNKTMNPNNSNNSESNTINNDNINQVPQNEVNPILDPNV